jgi:hypothetical protein
MSGVMEEEINKNSNLGTWPKECKFRM